MPEPGIMHADVNDFLNKIAVIESNNGKNTAHKEITYGPQNGQTAIGTYGLLPNTVDEVVTRSKDPALNNLKTMSAEEQKTYLESHPEEQKLVAAHLAEHVLTKQGGDQEKAAYAWLNGHNLSPEKIEKRDYKNSDYVKKFNKISETVKPTKSMKAIPVPGQPAPPYDVGGTPEGDIIQNYMEEAPATTNMDFLSKNEPMKLPIMAEKIPEQIVPVKGSFNKLQSYLAPKIVQPSVQELIANQPKNPEIMDTLRKIRGS